MLYENFVFLRIQENFCFWNVLILDRSNLNYAPQRKFTIHFLTLVENLKFETLSGNLFRHYFCCWEHKAKKFLSGYITGANHINQLRLRNVCLASNLNWL